MQERATIWAQSTLAERSEAIRQLCDGIVADSDSLARQVCREIGKPMQDALASDLLALVQALDWLAGHLPQLLASRTVPGERRAILQPVPYGVVGVIGTWNYPLLLDGTALAWALAAGNGVVWKPSELATGCARALLPHFQRAGLPVEMVTGGGEVGQALCDTPLGKLAFTGGVSTGRVILAQLAPRGIPAVMELSGNDALILCDSKQTARSETKRIEAAARAAVWARVCNAGQSCVSPQRVYAIGATYEPFVEQCRQIMASLRTGIDYGPLRTDALRQRVHHLVQEAIGGGATLHVGGKPLCPTAQELSDQKLPEANLDGGANGFFYAPTLLTDVQEDLPIQRQDFFGPVLCVRAVPNEEDAIALANANPMALGASVWTDDIANGQKIASLLRAGVVTINSETLLTGAHPALPFGGMGASGFGRQRGAAGLEEFVQWKTISWQSTAGVQRHVFPYREPTLPILRGLLALKTARTFREKLEAMWKCADAAIKWK